MNNKPTHSAALNNAHTIADDIPDFSANLQWGALQAQGFAAVILTICHKLPARPRWSYRINKLFRGAIKRGKPRYYDSHGLGLKLRLLTRGNYCETRMLFGPQYYDVEELAWIADALNRGDTFVDIGGNVGLYSLITADRCPGVRIITVEPDPILAARMQFNADNNDLVIEPCPVALSDYDGAGELLRSTYQSGANRLLADDQPADSAQTAASAASGTSAAGTAAVDTLVDKDNGMTDAASELSVRVTTLLQLCDEKNILSIDIMKIDIEGHEHAVLTHFFTHASRTLWPRGIVIERTHDALGTVATLISQFGYRVEVTSSRNVMLRLNDAN